MIAIDFGTGDALAVFGPEGAIEKRSLALPRVKGGKTPRDEFRGLLMALLEKDDVVVESTTVGSSGCEVDDVIDIVASSSHRLYTLPSRAVKNYRLDYKIPSPKSYGKYNTASESSQAEAHVLDAEILYRIATESPTRLRMWHVADSCERVSTSVRPHDKRGYRDEESDRLMALLPAFNSLPADLRLTLGVQKGKRFEYSRSRVLPFAQALLEPFLTDGPADMSPRKRFEKILGLYDHGYPSHYRRMTISWMQKVAADQLGLPRYARDAVSRTARKVAQKATTRQIRTLFHLCTATP